MSSIFISSTFRDFQAERDGLNTIILPRLNSEARKYGESVDFCDLRWGIDTTDEALSAQKIVSVCFDEIDRADPYMVILIGSRYGYIPDQDIVQRVSDTGLQLEDLEISITQLEIEFGLFAKEKNAPHVYVYLRTLQGDDLPEIYLAESELHENKLRKLLERLRNVSDLHICEYMAQYVDGEVRGLEPFLQRVYEDLFRDFSVDWQKFGQLSVFEKERSIQEKTIRDRYPRFVINQNTADSVVERLNGDVQAFLALKGVSGSGKTVLFSHICRRMLKTGWTLIPAVAGVTGISSDPLLLVDYVIDAMETALGLKHQVFSLTTEKQFGDVGMKAKKERYLNALAKEAERQKKKILIALDAVDLLFDEVWDQHKEFYPRATGSCVRVFVTATDGFDLPSYFSCISLPELVPEMQLTAIKSLELTLHKELSEEVKKKLLHKEQAKNLLYLSLSVQRLMLMDKNDFYLIQSRGGGMAQITQRQLEILDVIPPSIHGLALELIRHCVEKIGGAQMEEAMRYIAVSRKGLRIQDLEALLYGKYGSFDRLNFYILINRLRELFIMRATGCIDFQHKTLRQAVQDSLTDVVPLHKELFTLLNGLPEDDPVRMREILYHSFYAGIDGFMILFAGKLRIADYIQEAVRGGLLSVSSVPDWVNQRINYQDLCYQIGADIHSLIMHNTPENFMQRAYGETKINAENKMYYEVWVEFANAFLPNYFGFTDTENRCRYMFFSVLLCFAEELYKKEETISRKKNLANTYGNLASIERLNPAESFQRKSLAHFKKQTELQREIYLENASHGYKKDLLDYAESLDHLMIQLANSENEQDLNEALRVGSELLKLYEKLGNNEETVRVEFTIGTIYEQLGGAENRERAYQQYLRTVHLAFGNEGQKVGVTVQVYQILVLIKVGDMSMDVGRTDIALGMYINAISYAEKMDFRYHDPITSERVIMAIERTGIALIQSGIAGNAAVGTTLLRKAATMAVLLLKEYDVPSLRDMLETIIGYLKKTDD